MTRILETDEHGSLTIPAELLAQTGAHARYVVEQLGDTLQVNRASDTRDETGTHGERMRRWQDLAKRIEAASITDKSAVEILSEMRR